MKIVILGAASSIHTERWVNAFAKRGHEIHLITMHPSQRLQSSKIKQHYLRRSAPLGYFLNVLQLKCLIKNICPDVIHVHYATGYGTLAGLAVPNLYILSVWGSDILSFPKKSVIGRSLVKRNLRKATLVTASSQALARATCEIMGNSKKISVIPFGVDTSLFKPREESRQSEKIVIGTTKSLEHVYGIDVLLEAFAKVKNQIPNKKIELVIASWGTHKNDLEALAAKLGISNFCYFLGGITYEDVPKQLSNFDIYVAPSRSESFGVAVVEASAAELPVIATRVGGLPEVVSDNVTGFLVAPDNPLELADRMKQLILDVDLRRKMGQKGRARVKELFNWEDNVSQMENLYEN